MSRQLIILFASFLLIHSVTISQTSEVIVSMDVPKSVTAGTTFTVKLHIKKGNIQSFSRLFQDLPAGLQASSVYTANSDFSFQDKRVRMIWFRLPDTDTFSVLYSVAVDKRLKGQFTLSGSFSYISKNERKSLNVPAAQITILPSPSLSPGLSVDIKDFEKIKQIKEQTIKPPQLFCLRNINPSGVLKGEYIVTVLIHKRDLNSYGKLEDTIPEGYFVYPLERKSGVFSFKQGIAKLQWTNLPEDQWFIISYRMTPQPGTSEKTGVPAGNFAFMYQNKTFSVPVHFTDVQLSQVYEKNLNSILDSLSTGKIGLAYLSMAYRSEKETGESLLKSQGETGKNNEKLSLHENVADAALNRKQDMEKMPSGKKPDIAEFPARDDIPEDYVLLPEKGLYFRIQIAASRQLVELPKHFQKMNVNDEIRVEKQDGWLKYTIGSFHIYEEARKYRDSLCNNSKLTDAFIVAYNNGKRISIQEALNTNDPVR